MIYLDNSATTRVRDEVREAMMPFLSDGYGNPSSIHAPGGEAATAIANARQQVAALLNCKPSEIFFTPCATYSNNVAILGRAKFVERTGGGKHLITSAIEHPACLGPAKFLEANGWDVTYLPVNQEGLVTAESLKKALRQNSSIVSLMWANNEIGGLFPIEELAVIAKNAGAFFFTDAVQVPGKLQIDVEKLRADCLALSGHKFYAPKGIGVLYKREGVEIDSIFYGGGQEGGLFPGTEGVANIVGIGKAAELARAELAEMQPRLRQMQELIARKLLELPGVRMTGPSDLSKRLPGHVSVVVSGIEGEAAVMNTDLKGVCISSASACHKGIMQPSHVVSALNISSELALGSLRISAGRYNTLEECEKAMDVIASTVRSLIKTKAGIS